MEIIYSDAQVIVCIKPAGVLSTDEPGGLPELVRKALGDENANVRTVHRLDRAVSGLMVLARTSRAASELSAQIREGSFKKEYMAVVHGETEDRAELFDLLLRDKARKMSFVVPQPEKGAQEARLSYETIGRTEDMSLVGIQLHTGRTHQIRVQFSSRGLPLVGERKYSDNQDDCALALWSSALEFDQPKTGQRLRFEKKPPELWPWIKFTFCL